MQGQIIKIKKVTLELSEDEAVQLKAILKVWNALYNFEYPEIGTNPDPNDEEIVECLDAITRKIGNTFSSDCVKFLKDL